MKRCPITYQDCQTLYSPQGLAILSKKLDHLNPFPFTSKEQLQIAAKLAMKLSIQGIQPKLSVILNTEKAVFEVVEREGHYILKSPHPSFDELPQNEDLTMKLAQLVGIKVPLHGLIYNSDGSLSYFIKRFDRLSRQKVSVEDFTQLLGYSRETKYDASMEKVAAVVEQHCPEEKLKLFRLTLFNFLVGNEDMHLKNFSLMRKEGKVGLTPAYDLLNTTIVLETKEEIALPLRGKKSRLTAGDLMTYFGGGRLGLTESQLAKELLRFKKALPKWKFLIHRSFLSLRNQKDYAALIDSRWQRLGGLPQS